jgi:hypothetical protein
MHAPDDEKLPFIKVVSKPKPFEGAEQEDGDEASQTQTQTQTQTSAPPRTFEGAEEEDKEEASQTQTPAPPRTFQARTFRGADEAAEETQTSAPPRTFEGAEEEDKEEASQTQTPAPPRTFEAAEAASPQAQAQAQAPSSSPDGERRQRGRLKWGIVMILTTVRTVPPAYAAEEPTIFGSVGTYIVGGGGGGGGSGPVWCGGVHQPHRCNGAASSCSSIALKVFSCINQNQECFGTKPHTGRHPPKRSDEVWMKRVEWLV